MIFDLKSTHTALVVSFRCEKSKQQNKENNKTTTKQHGKQLIIVILWIEKVCITSPFKLNNSNYGEWIIYGELLFIMMVLFIIIIYYDGTTTASNDIGSISITNITTATTKQQ